MKKLKFIILLVSVTSSVLAQTNVFPEDGNVGLGTNTPQAKLEIKLSSNGKGLQLIGENKQIDFHLGHNGSTHGFYWRYKGVDSDNNNDLELWTNNITGTDQQVYNIHQDGNMRFMKNVSIGCEASVNYRLLVDGAIKATEIKVEAQTADFVFEDTYQLKDLAEVETFIKTNKHLPEIPSAAEMEEQGVNLAEMNKLLLMKVEELTLYVIEQERIRKQMEKSTQGLEQALIIQKNKTKSLEERLSHLEKMMRANQSAD
jgi:hypothetical protein